MTYYWLGTKAMVEPATKTRVSALTISHFTLECPHVALIISCLVGHYFCRFSSSSGSSNEVKGRACEEWLKRWPRGSFSNFEPGREKSQHYFSCFLTGENFSVFNSRLLINAVLLLNFSFWIPFGCYYTWNVWSSVSATHIASASM